MAFGGTPTIVQVNDRLVRITGINLASANTSGTIRLTGGPASDLRLARVIPRLLTR